jgi:hypothetical protein
MMGEPTRWTAGGKPADGLLSTGVPPCAHSDYDKDIHGVLPSTYGDRRQLRRRPERLWSSLRWTSHAPRPRDLDSVQPNGRTVRKGLQVALS